LERGQLVAHSSHVPVRFRRLPCLPSVGWAGRPGGAGLPAKITDSGGGRCVPRHDHRRRADRHRQSPWRSSRSAFWSPRS